MSFPRQDKNFPSNDFENFPSTSDSNSDLRPQSCPLVAKDTVEHSSHDFKKLDEHSTEASIQEKILSLRYYDKASSSRSSKESRCRDQSSILSANQCRASLTNLLSLGISKPWSGESDEDLDENNNGESFENKNVPTTRRKKFSRSVFSPLLTNKFFIILLIAVSFCCLNIIQGAAASPQRPPFRRPLVLVSPSPTRRGRVIRPGPSRRNGFSSADKPSFPTKIPSTSIPSSSTSPFHRPKPLRPTFEPATSFSTSSHDPQSVAPIHDISTIPTTTRRPLFSEDEGPFELPQHLDFDLNRSNPPNDTLTAEEFSNILLR